MKLDVNRTKNDFPFVYGGGSCWAGNQGSIKQIGNKLLEKEPCVIWKIFQRISIDSNGCWNWRLRCDRQGYGTIVFKGKKLKAHRFVYWALRGPIKPEPLVMCHSCDNRKCVNPEHMFWGTRAENQNDMKLKGRAAKGARNGMAKLTELEIFEIRTLGSRGAQQKELAKIFGVTQPTISYIMNKKVWK